LGIELGDKKLLQLLHEMRALARENATEGFLRILWQQRISARIREMLLIFDGTNLNKLAECMDKLKDYDSISVNSTSNSNKLQDTMQQLLKQMATLTTQVEMLTK